MSDSSIESTTPNADLLSTPEKLDRVAKLVAEGEFPFPTGLSHEQQILLATEVRNRRHQRLVKFIARSIARDLWQKIKRSNR